MERQQEPSPGIEEQLNELHALIAAARDPEEARRVLLRLAREMAGERLTSVPASVARYNFYRGL